MSPKILTIKADLTILIIIAILILLLRWQTWGLPLDRDEGAYAYIASHLFENNFVPYQSVFDHKPPGIHLLYWFSFQIFGESESAVRYLSLLNSLLASALFYLLLIWLKQNIYRRILFSVIFVLFSNSFLYAGLLSNTEVFLSTTLVALFLTFTIACDVAYKSSGSKIRLGLNLLMGILTAIALMIKPNSFINVAFIILWIALIDIKSRSFKKMLYVENWMPFIHDLGIIILGATVVILPILLYFYSNDALNAFIESVITFNKWYVSNGVVDTIPELGFFNWLIRDPFIPFSYFVYVLIISPFIILVLERNSLNSYKIIAFLWLFINFFAAKIPIRDFDHYYFPLLQSSVIFWSISAYKLNSQIIVSIVLLIFIVLWGNLWQIPQKEAYARYYGPGAQPVYEYRNLGYNLNRSTKPQDYITLWIDEPEILFYAQRDNSNRYIYTYAMMIPDFFQQLNKGLELKPRAIISFKNNVPTFILDYIKRENYIKDQNINVADVYYRKGQ